MTTRSWRHYISRMLPLALSLALCLLVPAQARASAWGTHQSVDSSAGAGQYVSLALGSDGKLHLSYLRGGNPYNLYYATNSSGSWAQSSLHSNTRVLAGTALALDSSNLPHIAYYTGGLSSQTNLNTIYKTNASTWSAIVNVDTSITPAIDSSISLFMHRSGAHISYHDSANGLGFANYSGTTKSIKTVDSSPVGAGKYNSTAVDSQGRFHIVYFDATNNLLMYASSTSVLGSWAVAQVPGVPTSAGGYCALAIDSQDRLHVSYVDASAYPNNRVKYLTKPNGGSWSAPQDIGPSWVSGSKSGFTSIAVDGAGFAHVSYYGGATSSSTTLMYATNLGGSWSTEVVPADAGSSNYGMYSSIKSDPNGKVYIAYYDLTNNRLKLVAKQGASIAVTPASLDFGSVSRGGSSSQDLTITNNGQLTLDISSIALSGASAAEFAAGNCSSVLPGANCSVTVTLTPATGGIKNATLTITSNADNLPTVQRTLSASSPWLISAGVGNGGNGGAISPAGTVHVAPGQSQNFSIASSGAPFTLADVVVDSVSMGALSSYTFNNVSADHSIESLFVSPIRLVGIPFIYYPSLQAAYDAMVDSGTMQTLSVVPAAEALLVDQPVNATIKGGYEAGFSSQSGSTTLNSITISDGNLTPDGLVLQ